MWRHSEHEKENLAGQTPSQRPAQTLRYRDLLQDKGKQEGRRKSDDDLRMKGTGEGVLASPVPTAVLPASKWFEREIRGSQELPYRPMSSSGVLYGHGGGFDDIFAEVVPPRRPATPAPSQEAAAIDRIFQSLSISPVSSLGSSAPKSSLLMSQAGTLMDPSEQAFKDDLANVLVWFEQELTNSQRITTAFALLNHLTTWQLRFVLSLLSKPASTSGDEQHVGDGPPPGLSPKPKTIPESPLRSSDQTEGTEPTSSSITNSCQSELTLDQCNPELFFRDIPGWLRSLRLHKYAPCFAGMEPAELLAVVQAADSETRLELMGVQALGARRKLLRVLGTILRHQHHLQ